MEVRVVFAGRGPMTTEIVVWSHGNNVASYADFGYSGVCFMYFFDYVRNGEFFDFELVGCFGYQLPDWFSVLQACRRRRLIKAPVTATVTTAVTRAVTTTATTL
jgi:hypothetical protein